ncbi:MAG: hypothetical protein K6B44_01860 [Lachnospiraceae bacterium]|nr:hypothetical protein [Lachnospiraceae bacterium]
MKLDDDFNDYDEKTDEYIHHKGNGTLKNAALVASFFILMTLVIVLLVNQNNIKKKQAAAAARQARETAASVTPTVSPLDVIDGHSKLTAQDLDFWDDYADGNHPAINATPTPAGSEQEEQINPDDPSQDGNHTFIKSGENDGEWVEINPYLKKNEYDFSNMVFKKPLMLYYENGAKKSYTGVDISKDEGAVDFKALKRNGIEFVMLRLGQRGYSSGELSIDDNFLDNYKKAKDAELKVGAYFVTAAATPDEGYEEARFCLDTISMNSISLEYPLALSAEQLGEGKSRTDELQKMPRTNSAISFMKEVEAEGFFTLLYGTKGTLIKKYSLGSLTDYEIWYSEEADIPDYPYEFVMWQYDLDAKVPGISTGARMNISFVDYSVR